MTEGIRDERDKLLAEVDRLRTALEQIASMRCPDVGNCGANDRGECQAAQARNALQERTETT